MDAELDALIASAAASDKPKVVEIESPPDAGGSEDFSKGWLDADVPEPEPERSDTVVDEPLPAAQPAEDVPVDVPLRWNEPEPPEHSTPHQFGNAVEQANPLNQPKAPPPAYKPAAVSHAASPRAPAPAPVPAPAPEGPRSIPPPPKVAIMEWGDRPAEDQPVAVPVPAPASIPPSDAPTIAEEMPKKKRPAWIIPAAIAAVVAVVGGIYFATTQGSAPPKEPAVENKAPPPVKTATKAPAPAPEAPKPAPAPAAPPAPAGLMVKAPAVKELKITVNGVAAATGDLQLTGSTGEIVITPTGAPWNLHAKYDRTPSGVTLTLRPNLPVSIFLDGKAISPPKSEGKVDLTDKLVGIHIGSATGPPLFFKFSPPPPAATPAPAAPAPAPPTAPPAAPAPAAPVPVPAAPPAPAAPAPAVQTDLMLGSPPSAAPAAALSPGIFTCKSLGQKLSVTIDGASADGEKAKLVAATGEVVMTSADRSWSVMATYERKVDKLILTIKVKPDKAIYQADKVIAPAGSPATVTVSSSVVTLQLGNPSGPKLLLQYQAAAK